jgi:hypothetical protein
MDLYYVEDKADQIPQIQRRVLHDMYGSQQSGESVREKVVGVAQL